MEAAAARAIAESDLVGKPLAQRLKWAAVPVIAVWLVALIVGALVAWQDIASLGWVIGAWAICALIPLALVVPMVLHPEATIRRRVLRVMVRQDEIVSNRWMG